jgi:glycosyltransferase involved in cell wall biosynthesis
MNRSRRRDSDGRPEQCMPPFTWGLAIATYKRGHVLPRCLRLALAQSRPPSEVVVVDASPDFDSARRRVLDAVAGEFRGLPLTYARARIASSTAQRNQAVALARADVVFVIDDDSLMYPDCAEAIMRIYDADPARRVAGVQGLAVPAPPDVQASAAPAARAPAAPPRRCPSVLRDRLAALLDAERLLLPYDTAYPDHPLPPEVASQRVAPARYLFGFRMTFRREVIARVRFEELLTRYSTDDVDASYRASRLGALLTAFDARICHLQDRAARLSRFTVAALQTSNLAALYRLHGTNPAALKRRYARRLARACLLDLARDLACRRWSAPTARGDFHTLRNLRRIFRQSEPELRAWFPAFQQRLLGAPAHPHARKPMLVLTEPRPAARRPEPADPPEVRVVKDPLTADHPAGRRA